MSARGEPGAPVAPFTGTLALAASLAAVAGCLDAVSLARLTRTFVGFQTGNTVLVGLGIGRGQWEQAAAPAVAVLAYVAGSAVVPALLRPGAPRPRAAVRRLLAAAVGLLIVNAVLVIVGSGGGGAPPTGALRYASIVISAFAMACQTPVVRSVRGVAVSSTFSTGMLTRLGQALGSVRDPLNRTHELGVLIVLGGTIGAFLAGAILGGVVLEAVGNAAAAAPAALLVAVFIAVARPRRTDTSGRSTHDE